MAADCSMTIVPPFSKCRLLLLLLLLLINRSSGSCRYIPLRLTVACPSYHPSQDTAGDTSLPDNNPHMAQLSSQPCGPTTSRDPAPAAAAAAAALRVSVTPCNRNKRLNWPCAGPSSSSSSRWHRAAEPQAEPSPHATPVSCLKRTCLPPEDACYTLSYASCCCCASSASSHEH
jgi:hypothetical protein